MCIRDSCITEKGKGYEFAEKGDATKWHAPGLFNKETGEAVTVKKAKSPPKYQDVFGETIIDLAINMIRLSGLIENEDIESFSPLIKKQQITRSIPNDEVFNDQWHLQNTGQTSGTSGEDANVTSVWNSYTGNGIIISVVDDGLDKDHPDISPNYSPSHSYDWCNNDADPTPSSNNGHGTAAGGVAAAAGDNSIHVAGAAYDATLAGSTLIACWAGDSTEANASETVGR